VQVTAEARKVLAAFAEGLPAAALAAALSSQRVAPTLHHWEQMPASIQAEEPAAAVVGVQLLTAL
jgi:hypothetical protein